MDPSSWYYNRLQGQQSDLQQVAYSSAANPAHNLLLAHQQLRDAAAQQAAQAAQISQYNTIAAGFPPSLVQAAASNKNHLHQQALANLNMRENSFSSSLGRESTATPSIAPSPSPHAMYQRDSPSVNSFHVSNNALLTPPQTPVSAPWKNSFNNVVVPEPHKPVASSVSSSSRDRTGHAYPSSSSRSSSGVRSEVVNGSRHTVRHAVEVKSSQPIFPGQPPPLTRMESSSSRSSSYGQSPAPQPPPRQSSQLPSRNSANSSAMNRTAFPGQPPPSFRDIYHQDQGASPQYQQQAASPQFQQQPSPQFQQQQSPQYYNQPSPQTNVASPQSNYYQTSSSHDYQNYNKHRASSSSRTHQQQSTSVHRSSSTPSSQNRASSSSRDTSRPASSSKHSSSSSSMSSMLQHKPKSEPLNLYQQQQQQQLQQLQQLHQQREQQQLQQLQQQREQREQAISQQDIGLARLGALGVVADLNDGDLLNEVPSTINYEDLGLGGFNTPSTSQLSQRPPERKQPDQQKSIKEYNSWMTRASELLDLSSGDSRDTPGVSTSTADQDVFSQSQAVNSQNSGFIPQIVMNPWDPNQAPVMTLAPLANAMQAYQQQWLSTMAAASQGSDEDPAYPLGKQRVLCIPPDEDMGFLMNLPPPCNVILQPSTVGLSGTHKHKSPFLVSYEKYLKGEPVSKATDITEAPPPQPPPPLPGKKAYIPPYTPNKPQTSTNNSRPYQYHPSRSSSRSSSLTISPVKPNSAKSVSNSGGNGIRDSRSNSGGGSTPQPQMHHKTKKLKHRNVSDDEMLEVEMATLPKRESSRRKAKENSSTKRIMQERLLEDENDIPELDLTDSDDDATWTPFKDKEKNPVPGIGVGRRILDEDDLDFGAPMPKKQKTSESLLSDLPQPTGLVTDRSEFKIGDFMVLKTDLERETAPIWRLDSKTLLQRFNAEQREGSWVHRSANLFSGYAPANRDRYCSVAVKFIYSNKGDIVVKVLKRSQSTPDPELRRRSKAETSQFQDNFEVYIQALISQCLDNNFLHEVFSDQDDYFVSNIEKVDSVTLLRKDKVMAGVCWTMRFQVSCNTWPCLNDLGSAAAQDTKCGACDHERASTMIQMFGQPYNQTTLKPVPPDEQARMNRNFSVCHKCCRLITLYHRLHHQKHKIFSMCSDIVEKRKEKNPHRDTTLILNELLANEAWLEQQFHKMQDLWADADCFVR